MELNKLGGWGNRQVEEAMLKANEALGRSSSFVLFHVPVDGGDTQVIPCLPRKTEARGLITDMYNISQMIHQQAFPEQYDDTDDIEEDEDNDD